MSNAKLQNEITVGKSYSKELNSSILGTDYNAQKVFNRYILDPNNKILSPGDMGMNTLGSHLVILMINMYF